MSELLSGDAAAPGGPVDTPPYPTDLAAKPPPSTSNMEPARDRRENPSAAQLRSSERKRFILHLLTVAAIFVLGAAILWLAIATPITTPQALRDIQHKWEIWSHLTQLLFAVGILLLLSRATRYGPLHSMTAFLVSLAAVQQFIVQGILQTWPADQAVVDVPFSAMSPERLGFIIIGLYTMAFAVVACGIRPIGDLRGDAAIHAAPLVGVGDLRPLQPAALRAEDKRRRIKAYFSKRPLWPWVASALGVCLMLFAAIGSPGSQDEMFADWIQVVESVFAFSVLALLYNDRKKGPMYYFNIFAVLLLAGSLLSDWATGYPFSARAAWMQQLQEPSTREAGRAALISYYYWYWLLMGAVVAGYAMAFRFVIYAHWHLATEAEVDTCIDADFRDVIDRAFARLGVDRSRLIAEPICLRGFPNRSVLSNVFFGSRIDNRDRLRFTPQTTTVIIFTEDQVLYYEITIDLTTGVTVNETSAEFFYQDVSNVARVSTTQVIELTALWSIWGRLRNLFSRLDASKRREMKERSINDTVQFPGRDVFQINLDSGREMVVVLRDNFFFDTTRKRIVSVLSAARPNSPNQAEQRDADLPIDDNERAMRNIRSMLRDRKRALLVGQR